MRASRLVCFAIFGLICGVAATPMHASDADCVSNRPLRIMTYNIRLDTPADADNAWSFRKGGFLSQVDLLAPDVIGFQEVVPGQRADLVKALPQYHAFGGGRDDGDTKGEASPLFVRKARMHVLAKGLFWLSPTPSRPGVGWDAAYPRIATWVRLRDRVTRATVLVVNTHWDHVGTRARRESARQIAAWLKANIRRNEAPLVIGDFNATIEEESLAILQAAGLRDSRAVSLQPPAGSSATFNGWSLAPRATKAIDHVLSSGTTEVCRYHVLAESFDGKLASDHFPVIVDLVVPIVR